MKKLYIKLTSRLSENEWLAQLFVRICVGILFVLSATGPNKLGDLPGFIAKFEGLGIPLASIQAPMVAILELVCGALLVIGLATRLCALTLSGIMIVAMLTEQLDLLEQLHGGASLSNFLYMSEWLILLLLFWLVFAGAGRASLDWGLWQRLKED